MFRKPKNKSADTGGRSFRRRMDEESESVANLAQVQDEDGTDSELAIENFPTKNQPEAKQKYTGLSFNEEEGFVYAYSGFVRFWILEGQKINKKAIKMFEIVILIRGINILL